MLAKKRKKIFLVNRDFQLRYTKAAVGVGILSTLLTAVIILYPLYTFEIIRIVGFLPTPIFVAMVIAALINIIFLALLGIIVTHKIAGPMYSLVRHMRLIGMGNWHSLMRIREDDDLKFIVRNFNEMLQQLQKIGSGDLKKLDELISTLSHSDGPSRDVALEQAEKIRRDISKRINHLNVLDQDRHVES
ncbi:MAG: hypothetical protein R3B45_14045 [Bdellovibrionota bacterium]